MDIRCYPERRESGRKEETATVQRASPVDNRAIASPDNSAWSRANRSQPIGMASTPLMTKIPVASVIPMQIGNPAKSITMRGSLTGRLNKMPRIRVGIQINSIHHFSLFADGEMANKGSSAYDLYRVV